MSLIGKSAHTSDRHADIDESTSGRRNKRRQPQGVDNRSFVSSDDDGSYRRRGKLQNYGRPRDDDSGDDDAYRRRGKLQNYGRPRDGDNDDDDTYGRRGKSQNYGRPRDGDNDDDDTYGRRGKSQNYGRPRDDDNDDDDTYGRRGKSQNYGRPRDGDNDDDDTYGRRGKSQNYGRPRDDDNDDDDTYGRRGKSQNYGRPRDDDNDDDDTYGRRGKSQNYGRPRDDDNDDDGSYRRRGKLHNYRRSRDDDSGDDDTYRRRGKSQNFRRPRDGDSGDDDTYRRRGKNQNYGRPRDGDSDDDDTYRKQGNRQNYGRRHDSDDNDNYGRRRRSQNYRKRYDDDSDDSREFSRTTQSSNHGNLNNSDRGHSLQNSYDHQGLSPPYGRSQPDMRNYTTDSISSLDDRDTSNRDWRDSSLTKVDNQWDSSPNRRRGNPNVDRNHSQRHSPADKHRGKSRSLSQMNDDPRDTPSNNFKDRRRGSPQSRSERSFSNSEDSFDTSHNRRNGGSSLSLPGRENRHIPVNPLDRYDDPWDTPKKNVFNNKDTLQDKPVIDVQDNKTAKAENARTKTGSKLQTGSRQPQTTGNTENMWGHEHKERKVDPRQEESTMNRNDHSGTNSRDKQNDGKPSQSSKVSIDQAASGGQDEESKTVVYGQDENEERGNWSGKFDFILSMLGYAVGLGNVWRFPYLCYRNGGGAFLFPFLFMMISIGLPVFYLEAALGQFTSCGAMTCWHFAPLFKGLGIAMVIVSGMTSVYYNMIIGWSLHYMFSSFTSNLPFSSCNNKWNTENCKLKLPIMTCDGDAKAEDGRCLDDNGKETGLWNKTLFTEATGRTLQSPSQEYWEKFVLNFSDGIEHFGQPKWDLVLCLLLAWVICFLCLIKGIKTTGKVVYFTALFPYVVLIILFFRGVTLENADIGIKYFIFPNFERLADASVWKDAANQVFFSMSIGSGGLITLSSYNRFHNNILRDSIIVAVGDAGTCMLGGFVIFSYLGYMAGQLQVNIQDVAADGAGLAFVVYPEAVSNLPPPTLWAILFFIMLLTLGLDSQFAMVETVLTAIIDQYPICRPKKTFVILVICFLFFIFGLPLTCPGGMYLLQLMDNYVGGMTLIIIGFTELVAVVFIYGVNRFCQDIHIMTGSRRFLFWKVTWLVLSPLVIAFIFVFMFVDYKPSMYDNYTYPTWADVLGWFMTILCVVAIPVVMVFKISNEKEGENIWQKIRLLCLPTVYWGPALKKYRALVNYVDGFQIDPHKGLETQKYFVNVAFDKTPETSAKSESQASLGVSHISIISEASKSTAATVKSGMTYESNV